MHSTEPNWIETNTGDLIKQGILEIGDGYRAKNSEFADHGLPFLRIGNIVENGLDLEDASLFPQSDLARVGDKVSRPHDCAIATKATIGRIAYFSEDSPRVVYSPQVSYWRVLDFTVIEPKFLRYWLKSREFQVQATQTKSSTSMADYINLRDQRQMRMTLPPIDAQRKIGGALSSLDELLENNTRRIELLEEMAQAIYREWFVSLRFPGHQNVQLVDSDTGSLPMGWRLSSLSDVATIVMGQSPKSESYNEDGDGLPFHQGVGTFGARFPVRDRYTTMTNRLAEKDDILFSVRAPVGRINVANERLVVGRGLAAVRSLRGNPWFLLEQLKERFQQEDTMGGGTIFKAVTKSDVHSIPFLDPALGVEEAFERTIEPMARLIENLTNQNHTLRITRDLLLPQLISGVIDVSDLDIDTSWLAA